MCLGCTHQPSPRSPTKRDAAVSTHPCHLQPTTYVAGSAREVPTTILAVCPCHRLCNLFSLKSAAGSNFAHARLFVFFCKTTPLLTPLCIRHAFLSEQCMVCLYLSKSASVPARTTHHCPPSSSSHLHLGAHLFVRHCCNFEIIRATFQPPWFNQRTLFRPHTTRRGCVLLAVVVYW